MEDSSKWLSDIMKGKEQAIAKLVERYGSSIRRFLIGIVGNRHDAEDLAQEAFLRFLKAPRQFSDVNHLRNYLFQIAHNLAMTKVSSASSRREAQVEEIPETIIEEESTRNLEKREERELMKELLEALPPRQKKVVVLRNWEELSFREIGEVLNLAEGTVKAHYFFALKKLRNGLEEKRRLIPKNERE